MTATIHDLARFVGDLERKLSPGASQPLPTLPGQSSGPSSTAPATVVELDELKALGRALGSTWYAWSDRELRITTLAEPGDAAQPNTVLIHEQRRIAERVTEIPDPAAPATRTVKRHLPATTSDEYYRASILPAGAFQAALQHDAARRSRAAKRSDPAHRAAERARLERAKARARWLAGYSDVPRALLGLSE